MTIVVLRPLFSFQVIEFGCVFWLCESEPTTAVILNFHMCLQPVGSMWLIHDMTRGEVAMTLDLGHVNALNLGR